MAPCLLHIRGRCYRGGVWFVLCMYGIHGAHLLSQLPLLVGQLVHGKIKFDFSQVSCSNSSLQWQRV
ncbi:unnamed protein product [Urochloa humidicola]